MLSFDEAGIMIDGIAEELPEVFYTNLNGGINLLPDIRMHPESGSSGNLIIMGEYRCEPRGLGRYINIYYGSFMQLYSHLSPEQQREKFREILVHEFIHHLESLGGEHTLAVKDEQELTAYKLKYKKYKRK